MSSIQICIKGDTGRLIKKLRSFQNVNTKGVNTAIAEALRTSTIERFQTERSPENKKWKTSIRASEAGGKTLTQTSLLKNSIRAEANSSGLAVGTNDIRAATHQLGDTRTIRASRKQFLSFQFNGHWVRKKEVKVVLPARPFLGLSEEDEKEIQTMLQELYEE